MRILQLNDTHKTQIDLTETKIRHFKWNNNYYIKIVFDSGEAKSFVYDTGTKAQEDYQSLIDLEWMISNRAIMLYPEAVNAPDSRKSKHF